MSHNYRVSEARKLAGLSQKQLANLLGVSQQAVYYYEAGRSDMKASVLTEISRITGCTISYILGISDDPYESGVPDKETVYGPNIDPLFTELVEIFDSLTDDGKNALVASARGILAAYKASTCDN